MTGSRPAPVLPLASLSGPMPLVIAIMVALTIMAAAAGLALRNVGVVAGQQLAGGVTVQILAADPAQQHRQALAGAAVLRRFAAGSVRLVPRAEIDALIEPWLGLNPDEAAAVSGGGEGEGEMIPVPALIDAQLDGSITPQRLVALTQALHRVAPDARLDAQSRWLAPVFGAIGSLQWLAVALVALLAAAMVAAVLLAVRVALENHRSTIEIVHMLGGSDLQVARIVQRAIGLDAAAGAAIGLALGLAVVLFLGARFARLDAGFVAAGALEAGDWLVLSAIPLAGIGLAMLTARTSVLRSLARML